MKVKSTIFTDVVVLVSNIEDSTKYGKVVYNITARLEEYNTVCRLSITKTMLLIILHKLFKSMSLSIHHLKN